MIMNAEQLNRLNLLSEKVVNANASFNELKEFKELLNTWNDSIEFNLPQAINAPKGINFK